MTSKIYTIFIVFLLTAILILAGLFYWQAKNNVSQSINPRGSGQQSQVSQIPEAENETATTSPPLTAQGEISHGNSAKKQIIFTFDAGAGTNSLTKILEVGQKHNVKITFFVTGKFAEKNPELIKQIAVAGHEIFNHTYSHPHLTQVSDEQIKEELDKTEQIIYQLTGKSTKPYFRPPHGDRNEHVLEVATQEGYQSVFWSLDALDWMTDKTDQPVKDRIYSNLKSGKIILMHVGDNITGNILDEVFTYIENQNYKIVSLTEGLK